MKTFKKILIGVAVTVSLVFANGVYYVFWGQEKSVKKLSEGKKLNLYECCSIYSMHCATWMFGWILSPEAADQCFLMAFAKEGSSHTREFDFLKSPYIYSLYCKMCSENKRRTIINYPLNEITGNKKSHLRRELRYALALDGALMSTQHVDQEESVALLSDGGSYDFDICDMTAQYDKYIGIYSVGFVTVRFHWELLRYIQDKGWIHKVYLTYFT